MVRVSVARGIDGSAAQRAAPAVHSIGWRDVRWYTAGKGVGTGATSYRCVCTGSTDAEHARVCYLCCVERDRLRNGIQGHALALALVVARGRRCMWHVCGRNHARQNNNNNNKAQKAHKCE